MTDSIKDVGVTFLGSAASKPYDMLSSFSALPNGLELTASNCRPALCVLCPNLRTWLAKCSSFHFASSEALWQALKARNLKTFRRFTLAGDLGKADLVFWAQIFPQNPDLALKKFAYWYKKQNVGIGPKMATNRAYAERLGINPEEDLDYARERPDRAVEVAVWLCILGLKFKQNPAHWEVLDKTGDTYLIERDNRAVAGKTHWGGKLEGPEMRLVGDNAMGRYLMTVRTKRRLALGMLNEKGVEEEKGEEGGKED